MELNSELDRLRKYSDIDRELIRAKEKHPDFPKDMFIQLAIMQEEAGEVTKAVLHYVYEKGSIEDVREELIQTAAMCIRMIEALPNAESIFPIFIWYKCATCGNQCLTELRPKNNVCGGCSNPDWKLMKHQYAYKVGGEEWMHPEGEI